MSILTASRVTEIALEQELERMFRAHYQLMYRTAYSMLGNRADADDVPQTIFLRLLRRGLPADLKSNARRYLYRAAVNVSLDMIRMRKRQPVADGAERLEALSENSASSCVEERHHRLAEALTELHPETAQILILRYVHDHSDAEIAKLLGVSRGTMAMRLLRSRARLKKLMQESVTGGKP